MSKKDVFQIGLLFLAMGLSFPPIFIFHTEVNEPAIMVIKYLSVPVLTLCVWLFAIRPKQKAEIKSLIIGIPMLAFFILLLCYGYVLGLNHLFQKGDITISGEIIDLYSSTRSKSGTTYYVEIRDIDMERNRKFDISKSEYKQLEIGDIYTSTWKIGLFELVYK